MFYFRKNLNESSKKSTKLALLVQYMCHYEKTCSGMISFRIGMNLFRIGMNSFRIGMKSFRIDTGIWGNEKCQKIKLFM